MMHGHIKWLLAQGITSIFYPCMTYNVDEDTAQNCYNCPVVAYYPEVLAANIEELKNIHFFYDYLGLLNKKLLAKELYKMLSPVYTDLSSAEIKNALIPAFKAYRDFEARVKEQGKKITEEALSKNMPVIILAGRPYHTDPKINHGIDRLITGLGAALISEDSVSGNIDRKDLNKDLEVLNQWTYHSRLYAAAKFAAQNPAMNLVQLVSFGCGCDAITADECRRILEENGKIYTQIKIDDIENLGAARIRLRSLFAALGFEC